MIATTSTKAAKACANAARRMASIPNRWLKYARQMTTPETSSTSMLASSAQNSSFWPGLYLPMGGTPSSWLRITLPTFFSHSRSLPEKKLALQKRITRPRNSTNIATPRKGCRMRVQGPPPNRLLSQNSAGWNSARPDRPARMNRIATAQWLLRSLAL